MEPKISFELEVERRTQPQLAYWRWDQFCEGLDARVQYDGSLRNGREYATRTPRTLDQWRRFDLAPGLNALAQVASADRTANAGLHLHVDRVAFSARGLARVFQVVNGADSVVRKLSRRVKTDYCHFSPFITPAHWEQLAADGFQPGWPHRKLHHGKYNAVYCHDTYPTVELRFFRATLRPDRLYAALETARALWDFGEHATTVAPTGTQWASWVREHRSVYPALVAELKARRVQHA